MRCSWPQAAHMSSFGCGSCWRKERPRKIWHHFSIAKFFTQLSPLSVCIAAALLVVWKSGAAEHLSNTFLCAAITWTNLGDVAIPVCCMESLPLTCCSKRKSRVCYRLQMNKKSGCLVSVSLLIRSADGAPSPFLIPL